MFGHIVRAIRKWWQPHLMISHTRAEQKSTSNVLTATILIYASGAGITAAAGTRLALQLFLVKGFKLYSFQLQDPKEPCISIYCHYLPVSGLGNLRACCLPWMCTPFLRRPLRDRTLILRYPSTPLVNTTHQSKVDRAEIWMNHRRHKAMRFV